MVVPFGAGSHDWTALELGAWFASAAGGPLRLVGAADGRKRGRDASRLLADASLIVQRTAGIVAEPFLAEPGPAGVSEAAAGAALLVVGLSERWREEGLGRARGELASRPPAPTLFVRRGSPARRPGPGGDADPLQLVHVGHRRVVTAAFTAKHPVLKPVGRTLLLDPAAQGGRQPKE